VKIRLGFYVFYGNYEMEESWSARDAETKIRPISIKGIKDTIAENVSVFPDYFWKKTFILWNMRLQEVSMIIDFPIL